VQQSWFSTSLTVGQAARTSWITPAAISCRCDKRGLRMTGKRKMRMKSPRA
jgi:hypothetical protein